MIWNMYLHLHPVIRPKRSFRSCRTFFGPPLEPQACSRTAKVATMCCCEEAEKA